MLIAKEKEMMAKLKELIAKLHENKTMEKEFFVKLKQKEDIAKE